MHDTVLNHDTNSKKLFTDYTFLKFIILVINGAAIFTKGIDQIIDTIFS